MSQFREAAIIQEIIKEWGGRVFCEFGAGDGIYLSNTAELVKQGWQGTYIESNPTLYEKLLINHPGQTCICAAVTAENVNDLVPASLDVLSVDIDGNDYWVWKAYEGDARIVIIESNPQRQGDWIMEYDPAFVLPTPKHDGYGASPDALKKLAQQKGYYFVCNTGVNLIFVNRPHKFAIKSDYHVPNYRHIGP